MLSTANAPQLSGSPGAFVEVPKESPLQILLTRGQTILAYPDSKRLSMKFSEKTWDKIWEILSADGVEVFEMEVKSGGIEFPQKNPKGKDQKE